MCLEMNSKAPLFDGKNNSSLSRIVICLSNLKEDVQFITLQSLKKD